jgi:hypothetical protein
LSEMKTSKTLCGAHCPAFLASSRHFERNRVNAIAGTSVLPLRLFRYAAVARRQRQGARCGDPRCAGTSHISATMPTAAKNAP